MTQLATTSAPDAYVSAFEKRSAEGGPSWLAEIRRAAFDRFAALGFPTTRHEEWKYTNLAPLVKTTFAPADAAARNAKSAAIDAKVFDDKGAIRIVFVDGQYSEKLSRAQSLPKGVRVGSLAAALDADDGVVQEHLTRHAEFDEHAFVALNTAMIDDGAFVHVPRGVKVESPIHVVFVATESAEPTMCHPRNLFVVEPQGEATIVESYVGLAESKYFTNVVTEIVVAENAYVDHYKVEDESTAAFHMSTLAVRQGRDSVLQSDTISIGGLLVRNEMNGILAGENGECTLNGLYRCMGNQHVDNHLRVDHASPHCRSWEYFKGVLDEKGSSAFRGRIIVREGAQKTDAKQTNKNLLLSNEAHADTKPQLEIFADDVKCTHGATIGQIDEEAMFYLRSRGVPPKAARELLIYAFANESLAEIKVKPLRQHLERRLFGEAPGVE